MSKVFPRNYLAIQMNGVRLIYVCMYVCMYVCRAMYVCMCVWSSHIAEYGLTGVGCQSCSWSAEQGKLIFPCPRACLRIWSRETGSAVPSRVSLLISILRLNLMLTYGIPPEFRGGRCPFMKPPYAIGSVPSLSGHAIAYR